MLLVSEMKGDRPERSLDITEIFFSIQGESLFSGRPTSFVRTSECNLRCRWCDTAYAFKPGNPRTIHSILDEVQSHGSHYVCVTGGEPLRQPNTITLLALLLEQPEKYTVSLETGGSFSIAEVPNDVVKILDLKCPDSGEHEKMHWRNLDWIQPKDQIKFVIASRRDFDWAVECIEERRLHDRTATLLFSPAEGLIQPNTLASWILKDSLNVKLQLQLHKVIWPDNPKGT